MASSNRDQRRFPRLRQAPELFRTLPQLAVTIEWPNHELTNGLDLGYAGFSAEKPLLYTLSTEKPVDLRVQLGLGPMFSVSARIAWNQPQIFGAEVLRFEAVGREQLSRFVEAQHAGAQLRQVKPEFYNANDFDLWLQGPGDTHVFIWRQGEAPIERVRVRRGEEECEWIAGQRLETWTAFDQMALLVLSQMDNTGLPMKDFLRSLRSGV